MSGMDGERVLETPNHSSSNVSDLSSRQIEELVLADCPYHDLKDTNMACFMFSLVGFKDITARSCYDD